MHYACIETHARRVSGKKVQMEESTPAVRRATAIPHTVSPGQLARHNMGFCWCIIWNLAAAATPAERRPKIHFGHGRIRHGQSMTASFPPKTFGDKEDEKKPRAPQEKRYKRIKRHHYSLLVYDAPPTARNGYEGIDDREACIAWGRAVESRKSDKLVVPEKLQGLGGKVIKHPGFSDGGRASFSHWPGQLLVGAPCDTHRGRTSRGRQNLPPPGKGRRFIGRLRPRCVSSDLILVCGPSPISTPTMPNAL